MKYVISMKDRQRAHFIAGLAGVDTRTAERALRCGVESVRGFALQARLAAAFEALEELEKNPEFSQSVRGCR
jgi:hypothetical protein